MRIMSVFGTRPEAIKMCPLVQEIEKQEDMESIVCLTGQHKDMLAPILKLFQIKVDTDLEIMRPRQTLTTISTDILVGIEKVYAEKKPDIVLVHGDTTTSFVAALAAFYQKIPVGHVEAGLRSEDIYSPFPEEMNRCLTARIAALHFSPTMNNQKNLMKEGIREGIYVTGNTVIDAFATTLQEEYEFHDSTLKRLDFSEDKWILLTAHRRENLGAPLENICCGINRIVKEYKDVQVVYPVHPNPAVQDTVTKILGGQERIHLLKPLDVEDMHNLIKRSYMVMTDSGGLQEEAPACGVPVLVLRTETERPEAVEAGTVAMAGVEEDAIVSLASKLLTEKDTYKKMAMAVNPYGTGKSSASIVKILREWYRHERRD